MTSQVAITIGALLLGGAGLILFCMYGDTTSALAFLKEHGALILTVGQVIGLFYCGMVGNLKLGLILTVTLLTTIFWGW